MTANSTEQTGTNAGAASHVDDGWHSINWQKAHKNVRRLQARIVKATQEGRWGKVKALQRLLTHSFSGKALAVKQVTENQGKRTPGVDGETWNTPSKKASAIHNLKQCGYRPQPLRRVYIPKNHDKTKKRPLSIPTMKDRAMQALYLLALEPVAETTGVPNSYGFRKSRSCADAIEHCFSALAPKHMGEWVLEGDIKSCFDNIDHEVLMAILGRDIQDGRLLNLLRMGLEAGYLEDWRYNRTYSGTPQGGILSPLLANIYLHELDAYIEDTLIPQYTRGKKRAENLEYGRLGYYIKCAREAGDDKRVQELELHRRRLPSQDVYDPNFRRLKYIRYADDFILSFIGTKSEAEEVKTAIGVFLKERLHLELNASKTLITHSRTQHARFLGYDISVYHADDKLSPRSGTLTKTRSVNGCIRLGIPYGKVDELCRRYLRGEKPIHEAGLLAFSDAQIVDVYQQRYRGVAEYYKFATDRNALRKLKYVMEVSLTKTLANKFKSTVGRMYKKYGGKRTVQGYTYKVLVVEVPTKNGTRYVYWGGIPLKVIKTGAETLDDNNGRRNVTLSSRTDLVQRLQANECEICGSQENCEVHHVRKLADLKNRWRGRKEKPAWVIRMIAMQRKTLVVCVKCHDAIHTGKPLPTPSA